MAQIWIMVGAIILAVLVVMKISSTKQELAAKLVLIFFIFAMVTGGLVYIQSNSNLTSPDGIMDFSKAYFVWFSNAFGNARDVSGYISKQDWKNEIRNKTE